MFLYFLVYFYYFMPPFWAHFWKIKFKKTICVKNNSKFLEDKKNFFKNKLQKVRIKGTKKYKKIPALVLRPKCYFLHAYNF